MNKKRNNDKTYDALNAESKSKSFRNNWRLFMVPIKPRP